MKKCNIDHSQTDILKKFEDQKGFLPKTLKKYDLATDEIREERNKKLEMLLGEIILVESQTRISE